MAVYEVRDCGIDSTRWPPVASGDIRQARGKSVIVHHIRSRVPLSPEFIECREELIVREHNPKVNFHDLLTQFEQCILDIVFGLPPQRMPSPRCGAQSSNGSSYPTLTGASPRVGPGREYMR